MQTENQFPAPRKLKLTKEQIKPLVGNEGVTLQYATGAACFPKSAGCLDTYRQCGEASVMACRFGF